ncbi:Msl2 [Phodopus roborovskii]|uniref:Msl2 protein n=1 Tax=Phodopus roborovskii TaxID=109678 RepID=A0AAU9YVP4_PHORO|nr:Msl2 [Phodopus roborovskii]
MNPVNATALYISASRLVLNYDPGDPKAFTEINRLLPYFRQSLSCCSGRYNVDAPPARDLSAPGSITDGLKIFHRLFFSVVLIPGGLAALLFL